MARPNDTSTVLNPGVGGDTMDESSVTQVTTGTAAKRPRVVPGGDDGTLQTFSVKPDRVVAEVSDGDIVTELRNMLVEMRRQTHALYLIVDELGGSAPVLVDKIREID